jgi:hypothetical protein
MTARPGTSDPVPGAVGVGKTSDLVHSLRPERSR